MRARDADHYLLKYFLLVRLGAWEGFLFRG